MLKQTAQRLILAGSATAILCLGSIGMYGQTKADATLTLMPVPSSVQKGAGVIGITKNFRYSFAAFHDQRLEKGVRRFLDRLEFASGTQLLKEPSADAATATFVVEVKGAGQAVQSLDEDESYSLTVDGKQIRLQAQTVVGALRGLSTLRQLLEVHDGSASIPSVKIDDKPRFRWRGLMIDSCRHFEPLPVILRTLDAMEDVKLNVLHWHLSEDQGFRVESKKYPKLHEFGSDGLYYSQDQVREVIAYARERGIRVVPEFDMPGHVTSWLVGYPELASGPGPYKVQRVFGVHDPAFDPTKESTYTFLNGFIEEMGKLFPDPYFHIGGDESNGAQWKSNPRIVAFMKDKNLKDTEALQTYFNQQLLKIVVRHNKHMVGWDEIFHPDLPKDVVVQSWRGDASLASGAKQGYQGILSAPYYLDGMRSAEQHYLADPVPASSHLSNAEAALILGGEACMWAEQINERTIDSRIWPRMAAIAERFWSPVEVRDVDDMYRRLRVESVRLEEVGLKHLSGPQMMQRSLAGGKGESALSVLASVIEPVGFGERYEAQHTDQLTLLDRLVDSVAPDPASRHDLEIEVKQFLSEEPKHRSEGEVLKTEFLRWQSAIPALTELVARSPRMSDAGPVVERLQVLSKIGLEAVAYLESGTTPVESWKKQSLDALEAAKKPVAIVRFPMIPALEQLVKAAAKE